MSTATNTPEKAARKRIKLVKFDVPDTSIVDKLISDGKVRKIDIPAKEARTTATGKERKAQPARTELLGDSRSAVLALYGGNEKAVNLAASLYREAYIKRMNSKGKVADPDRAVNRTSETFAKLDLSSLPPDVQEAARVFAEYAAKNPVAPVKRKPKAAKA